MQSEEYKQKRAEASKRACKRLYYERKSWGVCVACGKPLPKDCNTTVCSKCLEKRRGQRSHRRERIRTQSKEYRIRHKQAGLCVHCSNPAAEGYTMCDFHRSYYRELARKNRMVKEADLVKPQ